MKAFAWLLISGFASGCALTGKADVVPARYFDPELAQPRADLDAGAARPTAAEDAPEIRLGRVTAASYLRERFVVRSSDVAVDFDEVRRWTERPEVYLRRRLSRSLFEQRGMRQGMNYLSPVLDVELTAFDEVKPSEGEHRVRVAVMYAIHDERAVFGGETYAADLKVAGEGDEAVVRAFSIALDDVIARIASRVVVLRPPATPPPAPSLAAPVPSAKRSR